MFLFKQINHFMNNWGMNVEYGREEKRTQIKEKRNRWKKAALSQQQCTIKVFKRLQFTYLPLPNELAL